MRRLPLLPGPALLGFATHFDSAWGASLSGGPLPIVTPSSVGGTLLPFACPNCGAVRPKVVAPETRHLYADRDRGFSWCPACQGRYVINFEGQPLVEALPPDATFAPARVERDGKVGLLAGPVRRGALETLGAMR